MRTTFSIRNRGLVSLLIIVSTVLQVSCKSSAAENAKTPPPPQLPVYSVVEAPANTYQEFPASLEGRVNVEIRPQVEGYLDKIYVEEGAYVHAGASLFKIDDRPFRERVSTAEASMAAAKANLERASVEVSRLEPLVEAQVISDVQLKTARAAGDAAKAQLDQAKSMLANARIELGYTIVKAPASGYLGRIPYKAGSLVGRGDAEPLTILSDVTEMFAYFSMSEVDFIAFNRQFSGNSVEEKINKVPPVELILPDNSMYERPGKIRNIEGQFDRTMGSIVFRAAFPNPGRILRTGNTGKVRITQLNSSALLVPQDATFEIQDKIFVFTVNDSNAVYSKPITVKGKSAQYYYVENGIRAGEKIVLTGIGTIRDGMIIDPQPVSVDSLRLMKPL